RLQRDRSRSPHVLNTGLRDLFRVLVEHRAPGLFHVAETIEAPASAVCRAVLKSLGFIEIHEQLRLAKGLQIDVDQALLYLELGHVIAPSFAPVPDGRNIDAIQIWMPIVAPARLGHKGAPMFQVQRIAEIWLPNVRVL